ncbi:pyrroloquinoline-quinone glucose dehydrogenase [Longibacter salinarum]|uniref:Pyrroloquinoline-quinone glucose dehydrogenase n=1 Tax=Longibacter salinarum TaxID=1850348 RepID=A0A2A8CZZ3_9BACT|nr:PQQ-dependent sugar dehydrogenase [Longibacter salinarum]PEN14163.1 pyrroloquinoline-quinone glucose dehydrogenase [Longibacter salinarum]
MRMLTIILALILTGCTNGTPSPDSAAVPDPDVVIERVESEEATFRVVRLVDDLEHPWAVAWLPDGRTLITERPGRLLVVEGDSLDEVSGLPLISPRGQGGLMDIALHPEYESTEWIYFTYVAETDDGHGTVLSRARVDGTSLIDVQELYRQTPFVSGGRHFGSRIVFPGDGTLLFSIGDRGKRDPAQDRGSSIGSVIRLTLDGQVPDDNPFVGMEGVLPEIYSYGHRNIQGMAVHPQTGDVWSHEHGPRGGDELNLIRRGINYGWPEITYGREYMSNREIGGFEQEGMEQPVTYWDPSIAPSGLAIYNGDRFPNWKGNFFVGALAHQKIQRVVLDGRTVVHQETLLENDLGRIRDVRTGPDGYLYLLTDASDGGLFRLEPVE